MLKYDKAAPRGINESILAAHARLIAFIWDSVGRCESDCLGRATGAGVSAVGGNSIQCKNAFRGVVVAQVSICPARVPRRGNACNREHKQHSQ